jgi:hypothetical protein
MKRIRDLIIIEKWLLIILLLYLYSPFFESLFSCETFVKKKIDFPLTLFKRKVITQFSTKHFYSKPRIEKHD